MKHAGTITAFALVSIATFPTTAVASNGLARGATPEAGLAKRAKTPVYCAFVR